MAKKLEEKEIVIAEQNGQLKAVKNELSQEKERLIATKKKLSPLMLRLTKRCWKKEVQKKLARGVRGELKQHKIKLKLLRHSSMFSLEKTPRKEN